MLLKNAQCTAYNGVMAQKFKLGHLYT